MSDPSSTAKPLRNEKQYYRPPLPKGLFNRFLERKAERVDDDPGEWTWGETLWRHYKRWTFLNGLQPSEHQRRMFKWFEKEGVPQRVENGLTLWALRLTDPKAQDRARDERDKHKKLIVLGQVRVVKDELFAAGPHGRERVTLTVGTVLDWMTPSDAEAADIKRLYDRDLKNKVQTPVHSLVVMWAGKRRIIPADSVERIS